MNSSKREALKILNNTRLPVLPAGIPELLNSLADENVTSAELSRIIGRFPTIAVRLLFVANSAWSAPVQSIDSLASACSRLGINIVKSISIALAVASPFSPQRCRSFDMQRFWCRSLLTADIAVSLALTTDRDSSSGQVRTAALLHNLGLLWLADQLPDEIHQVLMKHRDTPESQLGQLLNDDIGFDYADAGSFLGMEWGLPESLVTAIAYQREPESYIEHGESACIVGHAIALAQAAERDAPELMPKSLMPLIGIKQSELDEQFSTIRRLFKQNQTLAQALF